MTAQWQRPTLGVWFREVSVFQRWPFRKRSLYFYVRSKRSIERDAGKTGRTWVKQQKVTTRGTGLEREISRGLNSHMYVARYNLGQKLLKPITKYLFFALVLTKKLTVAKWKIVPPPSPIPILFVVTPEMHTWAFRPNQLWTGGGERATLFPLEMIVVWCEITKYMEIPKEFCPGL